MSTDTTHKDCIFCKIVAGEMDAHIVYEDDEYMAFLDIFPKTKGDTLLITKKHYAWTYDVPDFGGYWETARKVTNLLMNTLDADWTNYFTYGHIQHAHIHIMPRYGDISHEEDNVIPQQISLTKKELETIAEKVRTKANIDSS